MAATTSAISANKVPQVSDIFKTMSYGPAPEATDVVNAWLDGHKRSFGHFINGEWVQPEDRKVYQTKNPATGEVLASTTQGTKEDVDLAVQSARKAYTSWSALTPHERARHLYNVARHLQKQQRLLTVVESLDNGKPFQESKDADIPTVIRHFYHHAGWAQLMPNEMKGWKPVGVVGAIVPWNFPSMLATWKICPALAMGNTVVLKPATYTRLSALLFAEICAEAGLPPGVVNVITGSGSMGSMLATHDDVDKVAFTGSTEIGQLLRRVTAGSGKKISLELGGKSPVIVFESADLDSAVEGIVDAIWFNQGQVCSAGSRLLIQETVFDKLIAKLRTRMDHLIVKNQMDKCMDMGALVDESQMTSVSELVEDARKEGAEIYQSPCPLPKSGLFYPPTLITNVQTVSRVVVEEIFGPVLVALPFRTAKEGVALGNNTIYGLGASVWTENISLAMEVAISLKAGAVWINAHNLFDAAAGFGGFRQSGYGRDGGKEGLYEYVRPSWEERARPSVESYDIAKFGSTMSAGPSPVSNPDSKFDQPKIDRTYKLYYGGGQKRPDGQYSKPIVGCNGQVLAHVGDSNRKDVRNAVEVAHKAAPGWGKRAAHNRAQIMYYLAENLELRCAEFASQLAALTGCSQEEGVKEVQLSCERLFYWAAYADKYGGSVQETTLYGATVKVHEPVGVIGIACPDENPLLSFISLFAPAVARGNCVVVAPSDKYPLLALDLYQVFETSDLPGGVVNILTGDRDHITKYLAEHQDVQAMWYFGSAEGAKFVEHTSAVNLKRTWVSYGESRDWASAEQGCGEEFLYHSIQVKNIWIPMGDIFAN